MPSNHLGHVVDIYANDAKFLQRLANRMAKHFGAGNPVLFAGTAQHESVLRDRLAAKNLHLDVLSAQGRYFVHDAESALAFVMDPNGPSKAKLFALLAPRIAQLQASSANGRRVRVLVIGELVNLLTQQGQVEYAIQLERYWNELARLQSFDLYCGYDGSCISAGHPSYQSICMEHSRVRSDI